MRREGKRGRRSALANLASGGRARLLQVLWTLIPTIPEDTDGCETAAIGKADPHSGFAARGAARSRAEPPCGNGLCRALHRAGVHLSMPDHGTAGLRAPRHRLRAESLAAGIEIAETLPR